MKGMCAKTGKMIKGRPHLQQSIRDILTTRKGTRVQLCQYGSGQPDLVDAPVNQPMLLELYGDVAESLAMWEPRFRLSSVKAASVTPLIVDVEGIDLSTGSEITIKDIRVQR